MSKYTYCDLCGEISWFKRISENKAKTLNRMKIRVFMGDSESPYIRPLIVEPDKYEIAKRNFRNAFYKKSKGKPRKTAVYFWIPVAWYDRFSGEEVEAFDTVRGLEEYNHDFEW